MPRLNRALVSHTENTVKRFSLPLALVRPCSTVLTLFIKAMFPSRTGNAQETQLTESWVRLVENMRRIRVSWESLRLCLPTTQHWKWILRNFQDTRVSVASPGKCLVWKGPYSNKKKLIIVMAAILKFIYTRCNFYYW